MSRFTAFVFFLALGIEFHQSHGTEVSVTDGEGKLCLYADLMVDFSVSYKAGDDKNETVAFELPKDVTTVGSKCEAQASTLKLNFGEGHSWSVDFTVSGKSYQADTVTFSYNLSDTSLFPNATTEGILTVVVKPQITQVDMDTCYSCKSKDVMQSESVNQTLWNVLVQAFVSNDTKSPNITSCAADLPVTTVAPTTPPPPPTTTTTAAPTTPPTTTTPPPPTTTTTPAAPVTNSTPTTPAPTPTLPPPTTWKYSIKKDENSTACLLASFGLRIGVQQGEKYEEMNFEPNGTEATGNCGEEASDLTLTSHTITIKFLFINDTKKFRLHALNVTANTSSGMFFAGNSNLSLWEASVGSSYMCNKEQNYTISNLLTLYTFQLQVQPFGIKKGVFSTAEECLADAESFLVPIAVGVALLVLILIILVAYFIGRKRNMASGYESF